MSKALAHNLGCLMLTIITVSGLFYGGISSYLALGWLWCGSIVIAISFINGKIFNTDFGNDSFLERLPLCVGFSLTLFALVSNGHTLTLIQYVFVTTVLFMFEYQQKENRDKSRR